MNYFTDIPKNSDSDAIGFICKKCGAPAPVGIGYTVDDSRMADYSAILERCACGWSQLPEELQDKSMCELNFEPFPTNWTARSKTYIASVLPLTYLLTEAGNKWSVDVQFATRTDRDLAKRSSDFDTREEAVKWIEAHYVDDVTREERACFWARLAKAGADEDASEHVRAS